jgi:3-phosphoshikimate 1-carboxyvinyltransferase
MKLKASKTSLLAGEVVIPSSKSQNIRALILALVAKGESRLENILQCEDTQDALSVCRALGAQVTSSGTGFRIKSSGLPLQPLEQTLYSGSSGITTRFILPFLGLRQNTDEPIILNCSEQMRARPIVSLVKALANLGMQIDYLEKQGALPISVTGDLVGGMTTVEGITSQYLSALLLALPCAPKDSVVTVENLHERPYIEMTLNWLKQQGFSFEHQRAPNLDTFKIPGRQSYKPFSLSIAGDFSSASYFIAAASLLSGEVMLKGLDMADPQGDKRLVTLLQQMGADITISSEGLRIRGGNPLMGIEIDANEIPDLLPTLAVVGTYAAGKTDIVNVAQARIKETDRIHSMTEGLTRMGAKVEERADGLTIYQSDLHGACVKGYGDHRTVMALGMAGMLADGVTVVNEYEAINKTFPTFVDLMTSLGAKMEIEDAE